MSEKGMMGTDLVSTRSESDANEWDDEITKSDEKKKYNEEHWESNTSNTLRLGLTIVNLTNFPPRSAPCRSRVEMYPELSSTILRNNDVTLFWIWYTMNFKECRWMPFFEELNQMVNHAYEQGPKFKQHLIKISSFYFKMFQARIWNWFAACFKSSVSTAELAEAQLRTVSGAAQDLGWQNSSDLTVLLLCPLCVVDQESQWHSSVLIGNEANAYSLVGQTKGWKDGQSNGCLACRRIKQSCFLLVHIVFLKYVGHPWTCFFPSQSSVSNFEDWEMVTTIKILACQSTGLPNTP
jgi:hypothetical protein